jgi:secondary thiamine-phosphate synthase enzyme
LNIQFKSFSCFNLIILSKIEAIFSYDKTFNKTESAKWNKKYLPMKIYYSNSNNSAAYNTAQHFFNFGTPNILKVMKIHQQHIRLRERRRGFHLITSEIVNSFPLISEFKSGICQVFIQHTSASLTLNENADPTVRKDFEYFFDKIIPENDPDYIHNYEGDDDMPAHLKAAVLGSSVMIPIQNGRLALGTWQGIYLCEHRNHGGSRNIIVSAWGE